VVWPEQRIVVEHEGRRHAEDAAQFAIDIRRIDRILEADYRHVRVDTTLLAAPADSFAVLDRAFLREGTMFRRNRAQSRSKSSPRRR